MLPALYFLAGKRMKKLAVAAAVASLLVAGLAAQTPKPRDAQTPSAAPKLAASHPSTKLAPTASGMPIEAQNALVAQNCATCHSERMKAGQLVLAGFDAAKI